MSLSFALFRTYAIPSMGRLLHETGEFTARTQKRYDDTALLLDAASVDGLHSDRGRRAIRRINQMHRAHDISDADMRYVLASFVVVPKRWIDDYEAEHFAFDAAGSGWRSSARSRAGARCRPAPGSAAPEPARPGIS